MSDFDAEQLLEQLLQQYPELQALGFYAVVRVQPNARLQVLLPRFAFREQASEFETYALYQVLAAVQETGAQRLQQALATAVRQLEQSKAVTNDQQQVEPGSTDSPAPA